MSLTVTIVREIQTAKQVVASWEYRNGIDTGKSQTHMRQNRCITNVVVNISMS